jgi:hypothetical protein
MYHPGDFAGYKLETGEIRRVVVRAQSYRQVSGVQYRVHYRVDDGNPANNDLHTNGFRVSAWLTEDEILPDPGVTAAVSAVLTTTTTSTSTPETRSRSKRHGPTTKCGWLRWLRRRAKARKDHAAAAYAGLFLAREEGREASLTSEETRALLGADHAISEALTVMLTNYADAAVEASELHEDVEVPSFW